MFKDICKWDLLPLNVMIKLCEMWLTPQSFFLQVALTLFGIQKLDPSSKQQWRGERK